MALIQESHLITASNTDILAAPSRLSAIPRGGVLTLEYSALESNGTNNFTITCQTPEGDVPFENLLVPYNGYNTGNYTNHSDTRLRFQVSQHLEAERVREVRPHLVVVDQGGASERS